MTALTTTFGNTQAAYVFGKTIAREFYPTEKEQPLNLFTQNPTIYTFDAMPGRAAAAAGTGALATVSTWTEQAESPYGRLYTLAAITDPETTSLVNSRTYWEAINFKTSAGGQTQTVIRSFEVCRLQANYDQPGTSINDLVALCSSVKTYFTDEEIETGISVGQEMFKGDLLSKGWKWGKVGELANAKNLVAYKALAILFSSESVDDGDRFEKRALEFKTEYERLRDSIPLRIDNDGDGQHEQQIKTGGNYFISAR